MPEPWQAASVAKHWLAALQEKGELVVHPAATPVVLQEVVVVPPPPPVAVPPPVLAVNWQRPSWQVCGETQTSQALPAAPQTVCVPPSWHSSLESQQPAQLLGVQFAVG